MLAIVIETLTVRQLILAGKEFYIVVGHKEQVTSNLILTLLIQTLCYCLTLLIQAFLAEASANSPWQYFLGFPYCTILWAATSKLCIIYLHPLLWQLLHISGINLVTKLLFSSSYMFLFPTTLFCLKIFSAAATVFRLAHLLQFILSLYALLVICAFFRLIFCFYNLC